MTITITITILSPLPIFLKYFFFFFFTIIAEIDRFPKYITEWTQTKKLQ